MLQVQPKRTQASNFAQRKNDQMRFYRHEAIRIDPQTLEYRNPDHPWLQGAVSMACRDDAYPLANEKIRFFSQ